MDEIKLPSGRAPRGRYVEYVDGIPYPAYGNPMTKQQIAAGAPMALGQMYVPLRDADGEYLPGEQDYEGMSNADVMWTRIGRKAALGDMEAANMLLDRSVGKPKQHVETLSVTATLQDFLDQIAGEDAPAQQVHIVDADLEDVDSWL